jgi:curli biogenesis system outer membrane secretion channel CsgG
MKFKKNLIIAVICFTSGIISIFCSDSSNIYTGIHALNEEYKKDTTSDEENITEGKSPKIKKYSGQKEIIAVIDFTAKDVSTSVALSVSELIRTELINSGKYTVIERSQMKEILKEQGFQQTGCTDVSCAVEIGKLLSAKKMLVGSVIKLGTKLIISGRVVDVERGIGEKGASGKANSPDQLDEGVIEFINNL